MKKSILLITVFLLTTVSFAQSYNNFKVSIYTRAYELQKMQDPKWLDSTWQVISSQLKADKIYLETHRDLVIVDKKTLKKAIKFFKSKGLEVAGGITYTIDEGNLFQTYCYTNPEYRKKAQEVIEYTAEHFDEIILDDFFFTSCKCDWCVKGKGSKSWTDYRLKLMTEAAKDLIVGPAKKVNPNVKVIIKYPNWYEHFHELGFNLETEPMIFDGVYTGTETRDAVLSNQHLQPYLGYLIFRYFNNLKPGKNGGGWVDTWAMGTYDRYAEQLWLTIFAKAPEMTLFDYRQMLFSLDEKWEAKWKDQPTSFNYSSFLPAKKGETMAKAVAHSLNIVDKVAGELGNPYGIKSYKPYHSDGEDFLQNYLGMIGIPIDLVPEFPKDDDMIILTEQAKKDSDIVNKIEQRLLNGKDIIITSGLLDALQDKGIKKLVNLGYTSRKSMVKDFLMNRRLIEGETPMLIPQIQYFTNDSWELISGMDDGLGWPVLHMAKYANATLYVLTIPENFANLYDLPEKVLNRIREIACKSLDVTITGPSKVSLFLYDNNTLIVESYNDEAVDIQLVFSKKKTEVVDLATNEKMLEKVIPKIEFRGRVYSPEKYSYKLTLPPHSFKALKVK